VRAAVKRLAKLVDWPSGGGSGNAELTLASEGSISLTSQEKAMPNMRVILAQPRGFCAGVERAIEIVEKALEIYGPPVYVRHEIVHNKRVVETLKAKGARFVEEIDEIPEGAITIFSAHGVSQRVEDDASLRDLPVLDATCPLVAKVHKEGQRYAEQGYEVVLIGHEGHPEVEGTMGRIPGKVHLVEDVEDVRRLVVADPEKVAYVTQTTLSVDDTREVIEALKRRFSEIVGPDVKDICYATQNRQAAVRELAKQVDLLLVVGARNSSNSNRLREIGHESGVPTYLLEDVSAFDQRWLENVNSVGITAGASTPEELISEIVEKLRQFRNIAVSYMTGIEEHVQFKLPDQLRAA
jgi:4-hydroxy-3-methylbut-2-enyl diphosphate reductase